MVHKKKQDMVLNLGIGAKGNTFSDQTPTPTQFIRNCEEVGLFQDLQNVNPFEETFKRAVEAVKAGQTPILDKSFQSNPCDDTLHTPNVFPHITDLHSGNTNADFGGQENKQLENNLPIKDIVKNPDEKELNSKNVSQPNKLILGNINHKRSKPNGDESVVKVQNYQNRVANERKKRRYIRKIQSNDNANNLNEIQVAIKEKLKNNIQNKQMPLLIQLKVPIPKSKSTSRYQKSQKDRFSTFSKNSLKFDGNVEKSDSSIFNANKKRNVTKNYSGLPKEKIEILERNRAAATRCREKKKIYVSYLEKLNSELMDTNRRLAYHNGCLQKQVSDLQAELLKHHNCSVSNFKEETVTVSASSADINCKNVEQYDIGDKVSDSVKIEMASIQNPETNDKVETVGEVPLNDKFCSSESENVSNQIYNESFSTFYSKPCSTKSFREEDKLRKIYIDHSYFNYPQLTNMKKKFQTNAARAKFTADFLNMNIKNQNFIKEDAKTVEVLFNQGESVLKVQTQDLTL